MRKVSVFLRKNPSLNILYVCNPAGIHDIKWILFFSKRPDIRQFVVWEEIFDTEESPSYRQFFTEHGLTVLPAYPSFSLRNIFTTVKTIRKLNALIEKNQIDIVHMLFTTPHALYTPFIDAPSILTTRGSDILKVIPGLKSTTGIRGLHDRVLYSVFKLAFERAAYITCTSQKQQDFVQQLFTVGDRCRLVRTGVDVDTIAQLDADEHLPAALRGLKFIFSPRWIAPQYNVETQIAAIRLLDKKILEEYTFDFVHGRDVFAESAEYDDYYLKMSDEIRQVEGLKYLIFERFTQKEVWACFKRTSLAIMVPHTDGTPNTAVEAMAARCKLIMGDAGYDSVLFDDTCIRVVKTDAVQLARAIESALAAYPSGLLEHAFSKADQYGNRKVEMNKVLALYQSLIQSPK